LTTVSNCQDHHDFENGGRFSDDSLTSSSESSVAGVEEPGEDVSPALGDESMGVDDESISVPDTSESELTPPLKSVTLFTSPEPSSLQNCSLSVGEAGAVAGDRDPEHSSERAFLVDDVKIAEMSEIAASESGSGSGEPGIPLNSRRFVESAMDGDVLSIPLSDSAGFSDVCDRFPDFHHFSDDSTATFHDSSIQLSRDICGDGVCEARESSMIEDADESNKISNSSCTLNERESADSDRSEDAVIGFDSGSRSASVIENENGSESNETVETASFAGGRTGFGGATSKISDPTAMQAVSLIEERSDAVDDLSNRVLLSASADSTQ
jgi:hypothetical protein